MRTGAAAVAAADALGAVRLLPDWDIQLASVLASAAFRAFVLVNVETVECNRVK